MVSSKKGISSHQLHSVLEITNKSAWSMSHRIREAMRSDGNVDFDAGGGVVEVDETLICNDKDKMPKGKVKMRAYHHKHKMLTLVDRAVGRAKNIIVDDLKAKTLGPILRENIAAEAALMIDEAGVY